MKTKLISFLFLVLTTLTSVSSYSGQIGNNKFPDGPSQHSTPGVLCDHPTEYRYPEHIKYCERNVSSSLKNQIIAMYDKEMGFNIRQMPRGDFKIDHFIPLSIGGANDIRNLWPQHKSIYKHSDPLESEVANLIAKAQVTQAEAIRVIKECKLNLDRCAELHDYLKSLNH